MSYKIKTYSSMLFDTAKIYVDISTLRRNLDIDKRYNLSVAKQQLKDAKKYTDSIRSTIKQNCTAEQAQVLFSVVIEIERLEQDVEEKIRDIKEEEKLR